MPVISVHLEPPYLLFMGDVGDDGHGKTGQGIAYWRPELCAGQMRLPACEVDLGLPELGVEEAVGSETLDLLKTYELALQQDAQIRAAEALRSADRETQSQALAELLPSIQANAESNDVRQESSSNFSNGTTQFDDEGFGVSARQPLFNWGRWMRYKQAQRIAALTRDLYSFFIIYIYSCL